MTEQELLDEIFELSGVRPAAGRFALDDLMVVYCIAERAHEYGYRKGVDKPSTE